MVKYEYLVIFIDLETGALKQNDTLNKLGDSGWELVSVADVRTVIAPGFRAYFKRKC